MSLRYFFHISYLGTNYKGWQRLPQTAGLNVQEIFETQLGNILKTEVKVVGCGRTDARVHAAQFFFHVDLDKSWDFDLVFRLNKNLPKDIAVFTVIHVDDAAHARFSAVERTYDYFLHPIHDPYLSDISSLYPYRALRMEQMKAAVNVLCRYQDFRPFSKNVPADKSAICKVAGAKLFVHKNHQGLRFQISSNRFINGMIRIIVNKLLMIGKGELEVEEFEHYLLTKQTPETNKLAYPQGLHLSLVKYPFLQVGAQSELFQALTARDRWDEV